MVSQRSGLLIYCCRVTAPDNRADDAIRRDQRPPAGALKLPDLALALGFELRLGLDSARAGVARLVQTAKIRALDDAAGAVRESFTATYALDTFGHPMPGRENAPIEPRTDAMRFLHDGTGWYLLALPRYGQVRYDRDVTSSILHSTFSILHSTFSPSPLPVPAFHFESASRSRTRQDMHLVIERYDWNKVMKLANEGRAHFWRIDFGDDRNLADIAFSPDNAAPCRIVATNPIIETQAPTPTPSPYTSLTLTFAVNANQMRDSAKREVRDWQNYCWAYPDDARRPVLAWKGRTSVADVVEQDGVILVTREQAAEALRAMTYVVVPGRKPDEPGGAYNGYSLRDRVFFASASPNPEPPTDNLCASGPLRDPDRNLQPETLAKFLGARAAEYETRFIRLIEAEPLSDKKSAAYFKLEAPIEVKGAAVEAAVKREFARIVHTGTMGYDRQLVRPAHEVALGLWLARL